MKNPKADADRMVVVEVSYQILEELLNLPEGCRIWAVRSNDLDDWRCDKIRIALQSNAFDPVPPTKDLPRANILYHRGEDGKLLPPMVQTTEFGKKH